MRCFVCQGEMIPYFTKDFAGQYGFHNVEYCRCSICGMVVSKTHLEMSSREWEALNLHYHQSFFKMGWSDDDPRRLFRLYLQAAVISKLAKSGVLREDLPWVDYGCGDGKLVDFLDKRGLSVLKFDRYLSPRHDNYLTDGELASSKYDFVINTSVFEHVRSITFLDQIAGLVSESGVLGLHVLVCESIPKDPDWFYLLPVHTAFFTNKSMQMLFDRWGFKASIYHFESRMWFCFRKNTEEARAFVKKENSGYYFKEGFVDYWR